MLARASATSPQNFSALFLAGAVAGVVGAALIAADALDRTIAFLRRHLDA